MTALLAGGLCAEADGQRLRVNTPATRTYSGIPAAGRIANTSVAVNFDAAAAPGAAAWSRPVGVAGALRPEWLGNRRRHVGLDLVAETPAQSRAARLPSQWRLALAPGGAARYFRGAPDYRRISGQGGGLAVLNARLLLDPQALVRSTAFTAPAYNAGIAAGGIRDPLAIRDNTSEPRHSVARVSPATRHSQAELMESRLTTLRQRALDEGWAWFQRDEYQRARSSFQIAEMLDRSDPEPRVGMFFCCLAEGAYSLALQCMMRIQRWDARADLFGVDYRLEERYQPLDEEDAIQRKAKGRERMIRDLRAFYEFTGSNSAPKARAALIFATWHTGHRAEAVREASRMQEANPKGVFRQFASQVLAANERLEAVQLD